MARMIISRENLPRPQTNEEIFAILSKAHILPDAFAKKARGMGTFRNILVHGYLIIEEEKVYENLQKLDLLKQFVSYVAAYLNNQSETHE